MSEDRKSKFQRVLLLDPEPDSTTRILQYMNQIDLFELRPRSAANPKEALVFLKAVVFDALFINENFFDDFGVDVLVEIAPFVKSTPVILIGSSQNESKSDLLPDLIIDRVRAQDLAPSVLARSLLYARTYMQFNDEKHRLESEVQHSQKSEIFGQLCGGIVHDFNNKLAVISANIMRAILDIDDENKTRAALNKAMTMVSESSDLVNELLRFAKKAEATKEKVSLHHTVQKTIDYLRELIGGSVHLNFKHSGRDVQVQVVPVQLDQIIMNLVLNARDAVGVNGKIDVETGIKDDMIYLKIADNGCGMTPAKLEKIFEPFYTTKGKDKGTGLGLSIVRRLVDEMKADIHVQSSLGTGTAFEIVWACNKEKLSNAA